MAARIVASGQKRGFAADRKSAMSLALAYQRAFASLNAAVSPALASWSSHLVVEGHLGGGRQPGHPAVAVIGGARVRRVVRDREREQAGQGPR
jgi:hypothetical protein